MAELTAAKEDAGRLPAALEPASAFSTALLCDTNGSFAMVAERWQAALATVGETGRYTKIGFHCGGNGARTFTEVRVGLYELVGGDATLISRSENIALAVKREKLAYGALETPVDLVAGQMVYIGIWADDVIDIPFLSNNTDAWKVLSPAMCLYGSSATGLPLTFNQAGGKSGNLPAVEICP